jgi:transcriptional regulator with XRE-family HTH domain
VTSIRTTNDFITAVRARRRQLGLTQEQLAGVIGVHRTQIVYLESGHRRPSLDTALRVAQALGLDFDLKSRGE